MPQETAVDVHAFIQGLFIIEEDDEAVCMSRPSGAKTKKKAWLNRYYTTSNPFSDDAWTCCLSTVYRQGPPSHRAEDLMRAQVFMFDDVGTKAPVPDLSPTAIMETRPGNHQYLYAIHPHDLRKDEQGLYKACQAAAVDAGMTDKAVKSPAYVFRVPGSQHRKERDVIARLTLWRPERRWDLMDLMEKLGVDVAAIEGHLRRRRQSLGKLPDPTTEDPVLTWLREQDSLEIPTPDKDGFFSLTCPWDFDHGDPSSPARYKPVGYGREKHMRVFHCFHATCKANRRDTADFLEWVRESGGPEASVYFVLEQDWIKGLSRRERLEVLNKSLPKIDKEKLPDVERTSNEVPGRFQNTTMANVAHVAEEYGLNLRWNVQGRRLETSFRRADLQTLCDTDEMPFQLLVDGCMKAGMREKRAENLAVILGRRDQYNPWEEWIKGQAWDGRSRIDELAETVAVPVEKAGIWKIYLVRWLLQVVQAACGWRDPRQMSAVLVLVGPEGRGKTTWFKTILPPGSYKAGVHLNLTHRYVDSIDGATKALVSELGEIETTFNKSETGALKAFLSNESDTYRPLYAPASITMPRTTAFCGTVNRTAFIRESAGVRRYWPMTVISCDLEHDIDVGQLWGEMYARRKRREQWWLTENEYVEHLEHVEYYTEASPVADAFDSYWSRFKGQPKEFWIIFNISDLRDALKLPDRAGTTSELRELLEKHVGKETHAIDGKRRAWLLPDPNRWASE